MSFSLSAFAKAYIVRFPSKNSVPISKHHEYQINSKISHIFRFFFTYISSKKRTLTKAILLFFESSKQKIIQMLKRHFKINLVLYLPFLINSLLIRHKRPIRKHHLYFDSESRRNQTHWWD